MKAILLALLLAGCVVTPVPVPPDGPGDCVAAGDNLTKLGGCGVDMSTFVADCRIEAANEAAIGAHLPTGCLSAAKTCPEALQCR